MRSFENLFRAEIGALLVVLLLAAAPARAQVPSFLHGFYLALGGGIVALEDTNLDYGGALPNSRLRYDTGWGVSGAAGWRVLRFYRVELEVSHRENDVDRVDHFFAPDGSMRSTTYMANGYVDFPVYSYSGFVPYIGAGVGRAQFAEDIEVEGSQLTNSNSHAFAYQVIGGLEFPVVPRQMSITFEYRYLATTRPLFQDLGGFFYHTDYDSHSIFAGLRWGF